MGRERGADSPAEDGGKTPPADGCAFAQGMRYSPQVLWGECEAERVQLGGGSQGATDKKQAGARGFLRNTHRKEMSMSNQANQEKQPSKTIPSEEVRQFLLDELEARKQALVELSNEQLGEIAGGYLPTREQVLKAARTTMVSVACCGLGALAGYTVGNESQKGALMGAAVGLRTGYELGKRGYSLPSLPSHIAGPQEQV